jgi:mannitol operon transcriptional antiterminator
MMELLLQRKEEMTAAEIAADIKVSVRTVHRELAELERMLPASGVTLLKKSGKGVQLQASAERLAELRRLIQQGSAAAYSSEERKLHILATLLQEAEPLKLFALAHELRVTDATVSHDLDELESWVVKNGLQLVRRRGYGVEITGPESRMRSAICLLAAGHLDDSELFGGKEERHRSTVAARLLDLIGKPHLLTVEAALWQLEEPWLNELSESEYTDLLIRITVAVNRIRQGKLIERAASDIEPELSDAEHLLLDKLAAALDMTWPAAEARHLAHLLEAKRSAESNRLLTENELSCRETAQRLIAAAEEQLHVPFHADRSLREGLVSHMETALHRLQEGAGIRNPLLASIKKEYEELFGAVRRAVHAALVGIEVPDEEVGYLVMHFGASIERLKQLGRRIRAIIVCTSGIGSAKMLAVRLHKELPQIEIVDHVSWFEASRIPAESYDLIVSTVDLPLEAERYIKLSPLLTKEETEKLRTHIQDVTLKEIPATDTEPTTGGGADAIERLHRLQSYLNVMVRLVDQFDVHRIDRPGGVLRDILREACAVVAPQCGLHNVDAVVRQLLERQKASSQVIPDTDIALFHTRSEHVAQPVFALFRLSARLPLDMEDGDAPNVRYLLLMLAPRALSKESLEVLSETSSFLLDDKLVALLESGSREHIQIYLSQQLAAFYTNINKQDTRRDLR